MAERNFNFYVEGEDGRLVRRRVHEDGLEGVDQILGAKGTWRIWPCEHVNEIDPGPAQELADEFVGAPVDLTGPAEFEVEDG